MPRPYPKEFREGALVLLRKGPDASEQLVAVFRRAQTAADIPRSGVAFSAIVHGGDTALARRAGTTSDGAAEYLIPFGGGVCIASSDLVASGCIPTAAAESGSGFGSVVCSPFLTPGQLGIAGIVPDGASDVRLKFADGSTQAIAPQNGVVALTLPKSGAVPTAIEWSSAGSIHSASSGVPPDAAAARCSTARVAPAEGIASAEAILAKQGISAGHPATLPAARSSGRGVRGLIGNARGRSRASMCAAAG